MHHLARELRVGLPERLPFSPVEIAEMMAYERYNTIADDRADLRAAIGASWTARAAGMKVSERDVRDGMLPLVRRRFEGLMAAVGERVRGGLTASERAVLRVMRTSRGGAVRDGGAAGDLSGAPTRRRGEKGPNA